MCLIVKLKPILVICHIVESNGHSLPRSIKIPAIPREIKLLVDREWSAFHVLTSSRHPSTVVKSAPHVWVAGDNLVDIKLYY